MLMMMPDGCNAGICGQLARQQPIVCCAAAVSSWLSLQVPRMKDRQRASRRLAKVVRDLAAGARSERQQHNWPLPCGHGPDPCCAEAYAAQHG